MDGKKISLVERAVICAVMLEKEEFKKFHYGLERIFATLREEIKKDEEANEMFAAQMVLCELYEEEEPQKLIAAMYYGLRKKFISGESEHLAEQTVDWLIRLDIVKPMAKNSDPVFYNRVKKSTDRYLEKVTKDDDAQNLILMLLEKKRQETAEKS